VRAAFEEGVKDTAARSDDQVFKQHGDVWEKDGAAIGNVLTSPLFVDIRQLRAQLAQVERERDELVTSLQTASSQQASISKLQALNEQLMKENAEAENRSRARYEELQRELAATEEKYARLLRERDAQIAELVAGNFELSKRVAELDKKLVQVEKERDDCKKELAKMEARLGKMQEDMGGMKAKLEGTTTRLDAVESELEGERSAHQETEKKIGELRRELGAENKQLKAAHEQLEARFGLATASADDRERDHHMLLLGSMAYSLSDRIGQYLCAGKSDSWSIIKKACGILNIFQLQRMVTKGALSEYGITATDWQDALTKFGISTTGKLNGGVNHALDQFTDDRFDLSHPVVDLDGAIVDEKRAMEIIERRVDPQLRDGAYAIVKALVALQGTLKEPQLLEGDGKKQQAWRESAAGAAQHRQ